MSVPRSIVIASLLFLLVSGDFLRNSKSRFVTKELSVSEQASKSNELFDDTDFSDKAPLSSMDKEHLEFLEGMKNSPESISYLATLDTPIGRAARLFQLLHPLKYPTVLPTLTLPTLPTLPTITVPTLPTVPTITVPPFTIPTLPTITATLPTITVPTVTVTLPTITATLPTVTVPTITVTLPTVTVTLPTVTVPTITVTIPTITVTRPTVTVPTITVTIAPTLPTITVTVTVTVAPTLPTVTRPTLTASGIIPATSPTVVVGRL